MLAAARRTWGPAKIRSYIEANFLPLEPSPPGRELATMYIIDRLTVEHGMVPLLP